MSTKPELYYWNGRDRAELIRLMLAAGKIEFIEPYFIHDVPDLEKLKSEGVLKFNQLPLLKWDGINLVQSGSIVRYIAHRCGLFGGNETERYEIDMLYEGTRDLKLAFKLYNFGFQSNEEILRNAKTTVLPKFMPAFEKHFVTSPGDYLIGGKLSLADVGLLEVLLLVEELVPETFDSYPNLKVYHAKMKKVPQIETYLNGPQHKPVTSESYVAAVCRTLGWRK